MHRARLTNIAERNGKSLSIFHWISFRTKLRMRLSSQRLFDIRKMFSVRKWCESSSIRSCFHAASNFFFKVVLRMWLKFVQEYIDNNASNERWKMCLDQRRQYFCMMLERIMDVTCVCRNNGCVCVRIAHTRAKSFYHIRILCACIRRLCTKNDAPLLFTQSVPKGQRTVGIHSGFSEKKQQIWQAFTASSRGYWHWCEIESLISSIIHTRSLWYFTVCPMESGSYVSSCFVLGRIVRLIFVSGSFHW